MSGAGPGLVNQNPKLWRNLKNSGFLPFGPPGPVGPPGPSGNSAAGFGFDDTGIYLPNELLGIAVWPVAVTFSASNPDNAVVVLSDGAPTANAVYHMMTESFLPLGAVTILSGALTGTVSWAIDPYVHPAFTPMLFLAPNGADPTLAGVSGIVAGTL